MNLKTAKNDKIFERLHTARTAIPNHLPAITLPTNTTNAHPSAPTRGLPSSYPVFFVFSFVYAGFRGFRAPVGVFGKAPEYKKSPMPWGFHSTRLSWFAMLFWASEMASVTLN
jgi:hypothetical protein